MSKAFTKESDDDGAPELPDREISNFPNLVSQRGLALIDAEIARYSEAHAEALSRDDKESAARAARELRYWTARRNTAQVQPAPTGSSEVTFGSAVNILREDGRKSSFRIVGEDEADPANGLLSWASPLARAMVGKGVGDEIEAGATEATITAISI
ncbi:MAG: transcription elongation factor GreA [Hyphomonadaceae bacterium]